MKKITLFLSALSLAAILLTGCQKEEIDNPMDRVFNISFSRNALEYINIPVGKYFVYKVTGYASPDSIVVTFNEMDTVNFPRNENIGFPEHNVEQFRTRMTKYTVLSGGGTLQEEWLRAIAQPNFYTPYDSSSTADINLEFNGTEQSIFYASHLVSPTQTLVVEGVTYNNVVRTESNNGLQVTDLAYQKNTFYWARGIGIIRRTKVTYNGLVTDWTLLRHN